MRLLRGVYTECYAIEVLATPAAFAGAMTGIVGLPIFDRVREPFLLCLQTTFQHVNDLIEDLFSVSTSVCQQGELRGNLPANILQQAIP